MKLGLGTVQFGMAYGATDPRHAVPQGEVARVLDLAQVSGVRVLDTAPSYGTSEERLGECGAGERFRVVSKTCNRIAEGEFRPRLEDSLRRLKTDSLGGLLVHDVRDLHGAAGVELWNEMERARSEGLVRSIGASVYNRVEIEAALKFPIDLIQLPFSVFDQRLATSGWLRRLSDKGVEIHARSIFLQGLLLMNPSMLPPRHAAATGALARFHHRCDELGLTPLEAALAFAQAPAAIDVVLCGVQRVSELTQIVAAAATRIDADSLRDLAVTDLAVVDPRRWGTA